MLLFCIILIVIETMLCATSYDIYSYMFYIQPSLDRAWIFKMYMRHI